MPTRTPRSGPTCAGTTGTLDRPRPGASTPRSTIRYPRLRHEALGTRWHEDDLYRALADRGIPFLSEKAMSPEGTALWPEHWPVEKLLAKREAMGSALFNLQYQNDPSGMGGNVIRREWFR